MLTRQGWYWWLNYSLFANKFFGKKSTSNEADINRLTNPHPTSINDDLSLLKKQQDTMHQLREAKLAKQRYEVAKHDLAQKIKELYIMANETLIYRDI